LYIRTIFIANGGGKRGRKREEEKSDSKRGRKVGLEEMPKYVNWVIVKAIF